jgi:thioredoxin-related protein
LENVSKLHKRLELLSNVAIVIVALLLAVVLVKRYLLAPAEPREVTAGDRISIANVDFSKSKQTLLIALSPGCHFCKDSSPFYQRIASNTSGRDDLQVIAVLPQSSDEGRKYLDELGVHVGDVEQADFRAIQVRGTPTLVLVDDNGLVTDAWLGKLPANQEAEVARLIHCDACAAGN